MADSWWCVAENNTTLYSNHPSIKNKFNNSFHLSLWSSISSQCLVYGNHINILDSEWHNGASHSSHFYDKEKFSTSSGMIYSSLYCQTDMTELLNNDVLSEGSISWMNMTDVTWAAVGDAHTHQSIRHVWSGAVLPSILYLLSRLSRGSSKGDADTGKRHTS